jgi:hypothetical protein
LNKDNRHPCDRLRAVIRDVLLEEKVTTNKSKKRKEETG